MDIKEIERENIKLAILSIKGQELFYQAEAIWKKRVDFENWNPLRRFFYSEMYNKHYNEIKKIQMKLLELEVLEAIKHTQSRE